MRFPNFNIMTFWLSVFPPQVLEWRGGTCRSCECWTSKINFICCFSKIEYHRDWSGNTNDLCADQSKRDSELPALLCSKTEGRSTVVRFPEDIQSVKGLIFLSSVLFPKAQQIFRRVLVWKFLSFHQMGSEMVFTFLC